MNLLQVQGVVAGYSAADEVLKGVDLDVTGGEVVTIIGPNGAGKSTLLKTIAGLLRPKRGSIRLGGRDIAGNRPREVTAEGVAYVPQERNVFPSLTILENLEMAARLGASQFRARLDQAFERFPDLAGKRRQAARTLSGGQRQMLAVAMALMPAPSMLLLDEPSAGLSPRAADEMFQRLRIIADGGVGIAMVEQNALASLAIADRGYILVDGRNSRDGAASGLRDDPTIRSLFLGG